MADHYLSAKQSKMCNLQIESPNGIMLISGPSQADYNGLAYSIIEKLRSVHEKKTMTVEDSPTCFLEEVDQYQVNPKADFNRLDALKSCLNLHPEVIYVQNIKDPEITDDLRNAAETGQFIIAGIKAADVFDALYTTRQRLGSVITSIIYQQRVRRLCDHCKKKFQLTPEALEDLFIFEGTPRVYAWQATGCPYCGHTGYQGLIGIQELLVINDDIKDMIRRNASSSEIITQSKQSGFQSKEYDGIKKILQGLTTFEEIKSLHAS